MESISTENSIIQVNGDHGVEDSAIVCSVLTHGVCGVTGVLKLDHLYPSTAYSMFERVNLYPKSTFYTVPQELQTVMRPRDTVPSDCLVFIKHRRIPTIRLAYLQFIPTAGFETFFGFFPDLSVEHLAQSACIPKSVGTKLTLRQPATYAVGVNNSDNIVRLNNSALYTEDTGEYEKCLKIVTQGSSQISLMMKNVTSTMVRTVEQSMTQCLTSITKNR